MKLVEFKKKKEESTPLADKVSKSLAQIIDAETLGNFIMVLDLGDDEIQIATDTNIADATYLLEVCKLNLLMNPYAIEEETHH